MGNADAGPVGPVGPLSHYRRINTKMRKEHLVGEGRWRRGPESNRTNRICNPKKKCLTVLKRVDRIDVDQ